MCLVEWEIGHYAIAVSLVYLISVNWPLDMIIPFLTSRKTNHESPQPRHRLGPLVFVTWHDLFLSQQSQSPQLTWWWWRQQIWTGYNLGGKWIMKQQQHTLVQAIFSFYSMLNISRKFPPLFLTTKSFECRHSFLMLMVSRKRWCLPVDYGVKFLNSVHHRKKTIMKGRQHKKKNV